MKKILILFAFLLQAIQGQSVSFKRANSLHILKEDVLVLEYEYTSEVEGFVESTPTNLYNEDDILKKTIVSAKKASTIGNNIADTISLELPDETETTEAIAANDRYRAAIQLSDSRGESLEGVKDLVKEVDDDFNIEFTEPTLQKLNSTLYSGTTLEIQYKYSSNTYIQLYCAIQLQTTDLWKYVDNVSDIYEPSLPSGTDNEGTLYLDIPDNTTSTNELGGNLSYRIVIEVTKTNDLGNTEKVGFYSDIALDIQGTTLGEEKVAKPHNTIAVYPNPSSESIVVEGFNVGEKFQVQVFDIIGTQVLKKQMKTPIIDVSRLNEGIYILRVSNGNQHKTLKFSKKN